MTDATLKRLFRPDIHASDEVSSVHVVRSVVGGQVDSRSSGTSFVCLLLWFSRRCRRGASTAWAATELLQWFWIEGIWDESAVDDEDW